MLNKGWRTRFNGIESYVTATTRSKARYLTYLAASDVMPCKIQEIQVWRDKMWDGLEFRHPLNYEGAKAILRKGMAEVQMMGAPAC